MTAKRLDFIEALYVSNFRDIILFGHVRALQMHSNVEIKEAILNYKEVYQDETDMTSLYIAYNRMIHKFINSKRND